MIHVVRVIFGDTDQMGVVYYGNYMRYFEASRAAYLRALGHSHRDLDAWGVALPVVEATCRYLAPAYYEDLLEIHVDITEVRSASMRFGYVVRRGADLIAEGMTRHAAVGEGGRPRAIPRELREAIAAGARLPPTHIAV